MLPKSMQKMLSALLLAYKQMFEYVLACYLLITFAIDLEGGGAY